MTMTLLDDVQLALRISPGTTAYAGEVQDRIAEAKADLMLSGVTQEKADDDTDPLIRRAIKTYAKANFGWDNPDHERLLNAYDSLKRHLTLSQEYTEG